MTQSVTYGQLDDDYSYEQVREAFIRASRKQREMDAQKRMEQEEIKGSTKEEHFSKALLEVQTSMAKLLTENQRIMEIFAHSTQGQSKASVSAFGNSSDRTAHLGRGGQQSSNTDPQRAYGPVCYNCGQRGHYWNECQAPIQQTNRWAYRPQNRNNWEQNRLITGTTDNGPMNLGTIAPVNVVEEAIDLEGSGTIGGRVLSSNMVELFVEGRKLIEDVAAVGKRGRESSSSGRQNRENRPAVKKTRVADSIPSDPILAETIDPVDTEKEPVKKKVKRKRRKDLWETGLRRPRMMEGEPV